MGRDEAHSIAKAREALANAQQREAAEPPEAHIERIRTACRSAMRMLALRADREQLLAHREPLPQSSQVILARLRAQQRRRSRGER
jgi:hypothetical protein